MALQFVGCAGSSAPLPTPNLPTMDSTLVDENDDPGSVAVEAEDYTDAKVTVYANPVPCCNPLSIDFAAEMASESGVSGATRYEWRFGDGRDATGQTVNHTFAWADDYTVTVTAHLPNGETTIEEFTLELGSTPGPTPPDANDPAETTETEPPTADAGPDQQVPEGDTVVLDGSGSLAGGAGPLSFTWAQISGPIVALAGIDSSVARFTAPEVEAGGEGLVFQLTVTEPGGSAVDVVTVWVESRGAQSDEVEADAGPDQTVAADAVVQLDGSQSSAPPTPAAQYLWSQLSGATVSLTGATSSKPSFVAPDLGVEGGELRFELRLASGEAWDTDQVSVHISGSPINAPDVVGNRVVFLSGPEGASESGPGEVSWFFFEAPGVSDVFLRQDCCECNDIDSPVLTSDAQGVYRATIDVREDQTIWYYVCYRLNGTEYSSQSVYVNPPPGDPLAAPASVIWYHGRDDDVAILHEVIRAGVVTHIMVVGRDRVSHAFDDPEVLEAILIAKNAGLKVIWGRRLWNTWEDFQDLEDTFDPQFYAGAVAQVQREAAALGADYTALDCECYGEAPLDDYLANPIPEANFVAMRTAIEQAATQGRVDYVHPSGAFGSPMHANNTFPPLGRTRVGLSTYWDVPHKICRIDYPFEVFSAYVQPTTERHNNGDAPYFLPQHILRNKHLWSQQDGAPNNVNGLFLYPGKPESVIWATATMMADEFDQD